MRFTKVLCAALLGSAAVPSFACTMPPLVAIPAKEQIGDKAAQVGTEVSAYFEAMKAYTACIQQELAAAGASPQPIVKSVLTQRNNAAVAEAQAVQKLYNEHLAATPAAPAAPPAEGGGRRGRR
jgi:hypothetical protein